MGVSRIMRTPAIWFCSLTQYRRNLFVCINFTDYVSCFSKRGKALLLSEMCDEGILKGGLWENDSPYFTFSPCAERVFAKRTSVNGLHASLFPAKERVFS